MTRQELVDLCLSFPEYGAFSIEEDKFMGELTKLLNIAGKLEAQLMEAGITTENELRRAGSRAAWLRILARDPSACLMRLSALEGAIQGVRWHDLDADTKASLKEFYRQHKGKA